MGPRDNETLKAAPEANGIHEMMEMHLFDDNARKENALCEADTSADELRSVDGYLDDRLYGSSVGTVCEGCKVLRRPSPETSSGIWRARVGWRRRRSIASLRAHSYGRPVRRPPRAKRSAHAPICAPFLRFRCCGHNPSPGSQSCVRRTTPPLLTVAGVIACPTAPFISKTSSLTCTSARCNTKRTNSRCSYGLRQG